MIKSYLNNIGWFVGLLLLQVLILNNLHIGGYATPFLYIYFILKLKTNMPRNRQLLYGFLLGLVVDMFANTPGVHTAATVFLAFVRTPYLNLFVAKDNTDPVNPAVGSIGVSPYLKYLAVSVFTHHIVVFCLAFYSFADVANLIVRIISSTILSIACIVAIDSIRK